MLLVISYTTLPSYPGLGPALICTVLLYKIVKRLLVVFWLFYSGATVFWFGVSGFFSFSFFAAHAFCIFDFSRFFKLSPFFFIVLFFVLGKSQVVLRKTCVFEELTFLHLDHFPHFLKLKQLHLVEASLQPFTLFLHLLLEASLPPFTLFLLYLLLLFHHHCGYVWLIILIRRENNAPQF